jgi:hypothetical protein
MKSKFRELSSSKNLVLFLSFSGCNTFIPFSNASIFIGGDLSSIFLHNGLSGCETTNFTSIFHFSKIQFKIFLENSHVQKNAIFILLSLLFIIFSISSPITYFLPFPREVAFRPMG